MSTAGNAESETRSEPLIPQVDAGPRITSAFNWATVTAAAGLVLTVVGWILLTYYYERVMGGGVSSFDEAVSLNEISKFSYYSTSIGLTLSFAAFAASAWALRAVIVDGRQTTILQNIKANLGTLLILGIAMVISTATAAALNIYLGESGDALGDDLAEIVLRIRVHFPLFARALAATALLIVANALRTSNLGNGPIGNEGVPSEES